MNTPTEKSAVRDRTHGGEADKTLRLIASLPAPVGLEDRVNSGLRAAAHRGHVLHWPAGSSPTGRGWTHHTMARCAAAAAIVFVVGGGGWGVYSRVQPPQEPRAITIPHVATPGGFSNAGAMRTPQTLTGPILNHPMTGTMGQTDHSVKKDSHASQKQRKNDSRNESRKVAKQVQPDGK